MQRKYEENNIFFKIIRGEIPCNKVYEDGQVLCFKDINPMAPVHLLLVSKKQFVSFDDFIEESTNDDIAYFFRKAREIANNMKLKSYRIMANCGKDAGQAVFHYHLHIMGYK